MRILIAAFTPLALVACAPLEPLPLGSERDSSASRSSQVTSGPMVQYGGYRVVEPADWRGVNDAQAGN